MEPLLNRCGSVVDQSQAQLKMAAEQGMRIVRQYSNESRQMAMQAISENAHLETVRNATYTAWEALVRALQALKNAAAELPNPDIIYDQLRILLRDEICRNNAFFVCVGIGVGTVGGFMLGMYVARPYAPPVMKSIACLYIRGPDYVSLCHTSIPTFRRPNDILVRVRAASLNRLDEQISHGYGQNYRRMVQSYNSHDNSELPLVIGRACAGVVEGVGCATKSGLEIGDEVWLAAPWFETGLSSEVVVAPESRVGRKPFIIGFEGAASLPYSGCVALTALKTAGLDEHNCVGKRILVQDGCSPVGCVITQLCHKWGAAVTATCRIRSVPVIKALGAEDVIAFDIESDDRFTEEQHILFKELSIRPEYDVIFFTTTTNYNKEFIESFVTASGVIVDTVEPPLASDNLGELSKMFVSIYVRLRKLLAFVTKSEPDWGGPHLCHNSLDRLAEYVNDGVLQTVVDQVYTLQDADAAMAHVSSDKSIGSTIVTFRS